jgi:hypothetical protein
MSGDSVLMSTLIAAKADQTAKNPMGNTVLVLAEAAREAAALKAAAANAAREAERKAELKAIVDRAIGHGKIRPSACGGCGGCGGACGS